MTRPVRGRLHGPAAIRVIVLVFCSFLLLPSLLPAAGLAHAMAQAAPPAVPNGTLIREVSNDANNGRVYLIWAEQRHWIESGTAFDALGLSSSSITNMSAAVVALFPESNPIGVRTVSGGLIWPLAPVTTSPTALFVSPPGTAPGAIFNLYAYGFAPGETVAINAPGLASSAVADGNGNFSLKIPVAANTGYGIQQIYAFGTSSGRFGVQAFTVIGHAPAATVSVGPNPVAPGAELYVSGSGFAPDEQLEVFFSNGVSAATGTTNASGGFTQIPVLVPASTTAGRYVVYAYGVSSHRWAGAPVDVPGATSPPPTATPTPTPAAPTTGAAFVAVAPRAINPGSQVVVSGSGFAPGELVLVRLNGTLEGSTAADASGSLGGFLFTVPAGVPPGTYTISATGVASSRSATVDLSVQPTQPAVSTGIAVSPNTTLPGAVIVVAGAGFVPGETVVVTFNGSQVASLATDAAGSFTGASFQLPGTIAPGSYTVAAQGGTSGRTATTTLTVSAPPTVVVPRLSVSPSTVAPGGRVTVSGSGYAAQELVVVRLNGGTVASIPASIAGTFVGAFAATTGVGTYAVTASGSSSGRVAGATLHVVRPTIPGLGLIPAQAHRGSTVLVNGNNFLPGEIVLIYFHGQVVQAAQADSRGRISRVAFVVPGSTPYGVSRVTLTGARSGRSASVPLVVTPAPAPGPHLAVSPGTVHRGATLTLSGSGYAGGEIVLIRFRGSLVLALVVNRHGGFGGVRFHVPVNSPYGTASVNATGARSGRSASATVRVVSAPTAHIGILVSPGSVPRGGRITVSGHGFAGGEIVLIRIDGILVQAPTADSHGSFTHVTLSVPHQIKPGVAVIQATGGRSGRRAQTTIHIR